jgi:hypothetical protein
MNSSNLIGCKLLNWSQGFKKRGSKTKKWQIEAKLRYQYNYYNYAPTLCINKINQNLIKFHYFADTTERGDRGLKGGPKTG